MHSRSMLDCASSVCSASSIETELTFDSISFRGGRRRSLCRLESDVLIVVGGQEFEENSALLRASSDYFDLAIQVGQRDAKRGELRFDFPDKNPEEWELIRELILPFSSQRIGMDNINLLLPWLDALSMNRGLEECDHVLCEQLGGKYLKEFAPALAASAGAGEDNNNNKDVDARVQQLKQYLHLILDGLFTACQFNLRRSKGMLLGTLKKVIQDHHILLGLKECETLGHLLVTDGECRAHLWDKISIYLPADYQSQEQGLADPVIFPKILYNGIQTYQVVDELNWLEKRALKWLQRRQSNSNSPQKKRQKVGLERDDTEETQETSSEELQEEQEQEEDKDTTPVKEVNVSTRVMNRHASTRAMNQEDTRAPVVVNKEKAKRTTKEETKTQKQPDKKTNKKEDKTPKRGNRKDSHKNRKEKAQAKQEEKQQLPPTTKRASIAPTPPEEVIATPQTTNTKKAAKAPAKRRNSKDWALQAHAQSRRSILSLRNRDGPVQKQ